MQYTIYKNTQKIYQCAIYSQFIQYCTIFLLDFYGKYENIYIFRYRINMQYLYSHINTNHNV